MTKSLRKFLLRQNWDFVKVIFNFSAEIGVLSNAAVTLHFEDLAAKKYCF